LTELFAERQAGFSQKQQDIQARLDLAISTLEEREKEFDDLTEAFRLAKNARLRAKLEQDADILEQQIEALRKRCQTIKTELEFGRTQLSGYAKFATVAQRGQKICHKSTRRC